MNTITDDDVKNLARLARIELEADEVPKLQKDLTKILDYVDELKSVPTDSLPEISQVTGLKNILRADTPTPPQATSEALLKDAPATEHGYVKVKAVFED